MTTRRRLWLLGAGIGAWIAACVNPSAFLCSSDAECVASGAVGQCEPSGYCSFPNDACDSGYAYGKDAGEGLAGNCVEPSDSATSGRDDDDDDDAVTDGADDDDDLPDGPDSDDDDDDDDDDVFPDPECGNEILEAGEQCEPDLPQDSCLLAGFTGGTLGCTDTCQWDTSQCSTCGNGVIEAGETCDGANLDGLSCESEGYIAGDLGCADDCLSVDVSACTNCGNGRVDFDEPCDGADLGGASCSSLGYLGDNTPICNDTCDYFDTSACAGVECGFDPDPIGPCAPECDDCDEGVCVIDCGGGGACAGADITCPPGSPCRVECSGGSACAGASVVCPPYLPCEVTCSGGGACDVLELECGDVGACRLQCDNGTACGMALVECGLDDCEADCAADIPVLTECNATGCACTNNC